MLKKVILPALTLLFGPHVENLFSEIQNTITDKRNKLTDTTVSHLQTIRSALKNDGDAAALFPIGRDAPRCQKQSAVVAVQGSYKDDDASHQKYREEAAERDRIYGLKPVTKVRAKKQLNNLFGIN